MYDLEDDFSFMTEEEISRFTEAMEAELEFEIYLKKSRKEESKKWTKI